MAYNMSINQQTNSITTGEGDIVASQKNDQHEIQTTSKKDKVSKAIIAKK